MAARWHWDAELACKGEDALAGRPVSLLESIDLVDILPKWPSHCVEMGRMIGPLTAEAHLHLGIEDTGTPVAVVQGGPDAYVGMVGLGCVSPGRVALITGSSHLQLCVVPSERDTAPPQGELGARKGRKGVWGPYSGAPFLGRRFVEGGQSSTGSVLAWMRKLLHHHHHHSTEARGASPIDYDTLNEEAAQTPIGADGLVALTTFQGARTPVTDSLLRGALVGLTLSHSRGHVWRALLEGVCLGTRAAIDALTAAYPATTSSTSTLAVAGGSTRSDLWLQMHADVTNRTVTVGLIDNAPLLGAAILASVGSGQFRDPAATPRTFLDQIDVAIEQMVHESHRIPPKQDHTALYHQVYSIYRHLSVMVQPLCRALSLAEIIPSPSPPLSVEPLLLRESQRPAIVMPSILAADFGALSAEAKDCLQAGARWLHVDVCDGGRLWCPGALTLGPQAVASIHRDCPSLLLEAHVVSDNLEDLLKPLADAGTARVTFQLEQLLPFGAEESESDMQRVVDIAERIRSLGMTAGICIAPITPVEQLDRVLTKLFQIDSSSSSSSTSSSSTSSSVHPLVEAVDILAVSPGFGGQPFNSSVLEKVRFLHAKYPNLRYIEVDGGVSIDTAALAAAAGANVLIAGRWQYHFYSETFLFPCNEYRFHLE